jgi:hypothetical protein
MSFLFQKYDVTRRYTEQHRLHDGTQERDAEGQQNVDDQDEIHAETIGE